MNNTPTFTIAWTQSPLNLIAVYVIINRELSIVLEKTTWINMYRETCCSLLNTTVKQKQDKVFLYAQGCWKCLTVSIKYWWGFREIVSMTIGSLNTTVGSY